MKSKKYFDIAKKYAADVINGDVVASDDVINACKRFIEDLGREDLKINTSDADQVVGIIESVFVHRQGEALDGTPLQGKPFKLQPWQIFIVYNLLAIWHKGTKERKYKEAFIMLGRKNGKTSFVASLAFAVAMIQRKSGSRIYVVAAALKQALESFNFILFSLQYNYRIRFRCS